VGLDWRKHVETDEGLFRPTDIAVSRVNPAKANRVLGWNAEAGVKEIIRGMMDLEEKQRSAVL
jgi:GDPmannose 4,6-dehydratase